MKRRFYLAITISLSLLSSCNLPAPSGGADPGVATAAALTVEAALNNGAATPLASPTAGNPNSTPEAGGTISPTPQSASTQNTPPANGTPSASFEDVTNCRTGPGINYEAITQIPPGVSVEIVGFFPPSYWIVKTDKGLCWVAGQFVTPAGNTSAVPTVTAPPTPEGGVPDAPAFLKNNGWTYFCKGDGTTDITLSWSDKADTETGYRVLRNNEVVAELPANSTFYSETITLLSGQSVGYQIQAYNVVGAASSAVATITCP